MSSSSQVTANSPIAMPRGRSVGSLRHSIPGCDNCEDSLVTTVAMITMEVIK
jgi:hypothetical protein